MCFLMKHTIYWKNYPNLIKSHYKIGLLTFIPTFHSFNSVSGFSKNAENEANAGKPITLAHRLYAPKKSGHNVPIIILHGLLGSKSNWNFIATSLLKMTNNRMVVTLDARNHGDSPHTDEFNYDLMVSDLLNFLDDNEFKKVSLIGHSMGGRSCMLFTQKYSHLVESLIVVDISPVRQSPGMMELPKLFNILNSLDLDPALRLTEARKQATALLKHKLLDDNLIGFLMTNLVEDGTNSNCRWKFNLKSIMSNFESEICRYPVNTTQCTVPTLFVAGGDSDYIKKSDEEKIKPLFPKAQFMYIEGAGHWVHAEKPVEFLNIVAPFLNLARSEIDNS